MITAGVQSMPQALTGYRERGILRRMSTTPVRPSSLLSAQMLVHGLAVLVSTLLALAVGRVAFDVRLPEQLAGYVLALVLAVLAASRWFGGLGRLPYDEDRGCDRVRRVLPDDVLRGVWLPVQSMPHTLARSWS